MDKEFLIANEDAILRAQHSAYAEFCADEPKEEYNPEDYYDPDGGFWNNETNEWEAYDDMGR